MRSWVFRNRHRLEAIYGRLAADRKNDGKKSVAARCVDAEGLAVFVLVPHPRRLSSHL